MTDSLGYAAGKQRPTTGQAQARGRIRGVASATLASGKSTTQRVTLPAPFGTFRIGEYTSAGLVNGAVSTPGSVASSRKPVSASAIAKVGVAGRAGGIQTGVTSQAAGTSLVSASVAAQQGAASMQATGGFVARAQSDLIQARTRSAAQAYGVVNGQAVLSLAAVRAAAGGVASAAATALLQQGASTAQAQGVVLVAGSSITRQHLAAADATGATYIEGSAAGQQRSAVVHTVAAIIAGGGAALQQPAGYSSVTARVRVHGSARLAAIGNAMESSAAVLIEGSSAVRALDNIAVAHGTVATPIGKFGFQNARLPALEPLKRSAAADDIEGDLKRLFCDLYESLLSEQAFDANVLGAPHLGSLPMVRRAINNDGLVLIQGDRHASPTRYLYRAWTAADNQGRGLHFLRTYLQMLFPNACEVEQLWHDKDHPYPTALYSAKPVFAWWLHQVGEPGLKLDGSWGLGRRIPGAEETRQGRTPDTSGMYLTSRIEISLDFSVAVPSVGDLLQIIRSVIPARLLPVFKFWLNAMFWLKARMSSSFTMEKHALQRYPWCGRVITDEPSDKWRLGVDGELPKLPAPFGSFKLGARVGGKSAWRLKGCRIRGEVAMEKRASMEFRRLETIPPDPPREYTPARPPATLFRVPRRLNGAWTLGAENRIGHFKLDGRAALRVRKMDHSNQIGHFKILPHRPPELLPPRQARLSLSGNWKLGGPRTMGFEITPLKGGT